ncbi:MAG: BlaI/MecI/CopY family transcriptional regulator [Ardenticatenaceae bacterium]|nr:BlaI/MecI/CopY family transcriptional regulator [Ardenticatenaceae bacterium]HBY93195.1 CopY family transcriptional regulator [Chloroflexota bacterium]
MTPEPDIHVVRLDRPGIRKVLGDLEAEIMDLIWARTAGEGTTVRDIFEVLYGRRRIAYTTVMNTMTRLAKKNLLRVEKQEQAYKYYPTFTEEELVSQFVGRVLEDLLVSFSGAMLEELSSLADSEAAARARDLLEAIERRRAVEESD